MTRSELASPELAAVEVHGMTRASFIMRGALTAGAVYGATAVGPYVGNALAQAGGGDVDILNFALTLELLETVFYKHKAKTVGLTGPAKNTAALFADEEQQHVDGLTMAIKSMGGMPVKKPTFAFPVTDQASFLKLALTLENVGVGAYNGAGPMLQSKQLLGTAGAIVQVEARHAATIALLAKDLKMITPNGAFDKKLTKAQVLAAAGPLIKSK